MGFLSDVGGFLTGSSAADAAKESAAEMEAMAREGMAFQKQMYQEGVGRMQPYLQAGEAGIGRAIDLMQRPEALTPAQEQIMNENMERMRRESRYTGGLGGQRLKRLQQASLGTMEQIRQNELNNWFRLGSSGQQAAGFTAGMGSDLGRGVSGTMMDIGNVRASGIIGEQQAKQQGMQNMLQLGLAAAGGAAGAGFVPGMGMGTGALVGMGGGSPSAYMPKGV